MPLLDNPRAISILGLVLLLLLIAYHRRAVFSFSMIGVFSMCFVVFVIIGVLGLPWYYYAGRRAFITLDVRRLFDERDLSLSIILVIGGLTIVLLSYLWSSLLAMNARRRRASIPNFFAPPVVASLDFSLHRAWGLSALALVAGSLHFVTYFPILKTGILRAFIRGELGAALVARKAMGTTAIRDRLLTQLVCNVIPFYGIACLLGYRFTGGRLLLGYVVVNTMYAVILLILKFRKSPLIWFLVPFFAANLWVGNAKRSGRSRQPGRRVIIGKSIAAGVVLFSVLTTLYFTNTHYGRKKDLGELMTFAGTRILIRHSASVPMYVQAFPRLHPHYGLSGIPTLMYILNAPYFSDPAWLHEYYLHKTGNIGSSAIMDFYGAFGYGGWALGSVFLGIFIRQIDSQLSRLRQSPSSFLLKLYMSVYAFHLTQASIFRASLGYGGAVFFTLWLTLKPRLAKKRSRRPVVQSVARSTEERPSPHA